MRAKSNTVAFEEPLKLEKRGKGRPRIYGEKIVFKVFKDCHEKFTTIKLNLYRKNETVQYLCMDLLWKPIRRKVRFVLVKTGERRMISKALPKLSRFKTKTDLSGIKKRNDKERILATTRAIEVFSF